MMRSTIFLILIFVQLVVEQKVARFWDKRNDWREAKIICIVFVIEITSSLSTSDRKRPATRTLIMTKYVNLMQYLVGHLSDASFCF